MSKMKRYIVTIGIKTSKKRVGKLVEFALEKVFKNFKIMNVSMRHGQTDEDYEPEDDSIIKKKKKKKKKKKARCSCGKITDDNKDLAFREVKKKPEKNIVATYYCGCKGWD